MSSERVVELENVPSFLVVSQIGHRLHREEKTLWAIGILAGVVAFAALGIISIVVSAITGVILMILTGCLSTDEAY